MLAASAIGTIPGWLTVIGIVVGAFLIWRGGGGTALTTLQVANRVLEDRVKELERQQRQDAATIAELRGRTDLTVALAPILTWTSSHERHAQERHEGSMKVLALIAQRLGPDAA